MKTSRLIILTCAFLLYFSPLPAAGVATGKVVETFEAGGYTYLRLDQKGQETWLATRPMVVSVGDQVSYTGGHQMTNFHSTSLDRTFESILFVDTVSLPGQAPEVPQAAPPAADMGSPGMGAAVPAAVPAPGDIQPAEGGKTIAEIFADHAQLQDKEVIVRARVMKISARILDKNWITLADGTGTEPDNKLMVTSQEMASPGDLVVAKGVIHNDIDLGSGYSYKVLLEEAVFSKNPDATQ